MPPNTLPNTYTPPTALPVQARVLLRLPTLSLLSLAQLWSLLPQTLPTPDPRTHAGDTTSEMLAEQLKSEMGRHKAGAKLPAKRTVVDRLLLGYYHGGLNLLQLALVDCQMLVDDPHAYTWTYSTAYDRHAHAVAGGAGPVPRHIISFNSQRFVERLVAGLSTYYHNHVYMCRHPVFPLVIVRVQLFDLKTSAAPPRMADASGRVRRPTRREARLVLHRPFFIVVPLNSPHVIHSPLNPVNELTNNIMLQLLERALTGPHRVPTRLVPADPRALPPVLLLEAAFILLGNSRFGQCLGAWVPYADNQVDMDPLGDLETHPLSQPQSTQARTADEERVQMANAKFKGSTDGVIHSQQLFDTRPGHAGRKRARLAAAAPNAPALNVDRGVYALVVPVQQVQFTLTDNPTGDAPLSIKLRFSGSDVFAGLHELAARPQGPVDPYALPMWLTGEAGARNGEVRQGVFHEAPAETESEPLV